MTTATDAAATDTAQAGAGEVDRYLDAFVLVVQRHGLSRARVQDVAEEVGVARVTVYRQVGTVRDMTALLFNRELARVLPDPMRWTVDDDAVTALIELLAGMATVARDHPVLRKIITDEPQVLGPYLVRHLPEVLARTAAMGGPLLAGAIERGAIAAHDPHWLADWIARVLLTAVIAPPEGPLEEFFDAGLRPLLQPSSPRRPRRRKR
jgi:AcrR family transcriptional regulator